MEGEGRRNEGRWKKKGRNDGGRDDENGEENGGNGLFLFVRLLAYIDLEYRRAEINQSHTQVTVFIFYFFRRRK